MSNKEIRVILKERMNSFMPKDAEVMLFGSRARGYYSDASDWDLLVLLDRPGRISVAELGRISYPFYDLGAELDIEINPVIYTKEDWQYRKHTPFYVSFFHAIGESVFPHFHQADAL